MKKLEDTSCSELLNALEFAASGSGDGAEDTRQKVRAELEQRDKRLKELERFQKAIL